MNDNIWDYPTMGNCAAKLDELRIASDNNKLAMDGAIEALAAASQSETGNAFVAAYAQQVSSIQLFGELLTSEAQILRSCINAMQEADDQIAAQVRATFGM